MKELIRFRVAGPGAEEVVRHLEPKRISDSVFEVKLPTDHPEVKRVFELDSIRPYGSVHGWLISWHEITREYSQSELDASPLIHARVIRSFPEFVNDDECFEFEPNCKCRVPVRQVCPIVLQRTFRCKQWLAALTCGAWVCKPEFVLAIAEAGFDLPLVTPVFSSRRKAVQWRDNRIASFSGSFGILQQKGPIEEWLVEPDEAKEFEWLQIHPPVGPFHIVPPTDASYAPHQDDPPDLLCHCDQVVGPNVVSELHLRRERAFEGDWCLSQQFVGSSGNVFFPARELLVSHRAYQFLRQFRLPFLEFDVVHLIS